MVCEHLLVLENELAALGIKETFRGQAWSTNCREWVYYDVVLNVDSLRERLQLRPTVTVHENLDERSGLEKGFVCSSCKDAIMGRVRGAEQFD